MLVYVGSGPSISSFWLAGEPVRGLPPMTRLCRVSCWSMHGSGMGSMDALAARDPLAYARSDNIETASRLAHARSNVTLRIRHSPVMNRAVVRSLSIYPRLAADVGAGPLGITSCGRESRHTPRDTWRTDSLRGLRTTPGAIMVQYVGPTHTQRRCSKCPCTYCLEGSLL